MAKKTAAKKSGTKSAPKSGGARASSPAKKSSAKKATTKAAPKPKSAAPAKRTSTAKKAAPAKAPKAKSEAKADKPAKVVTESKKVESKKIEPKKKDAPAKKNAGAPKPETKDTKASETKENAKATGKKPGGERSSAKKTSAPAEGAKAPATKAGKDAKPAPAEAKAAPVTEEPKDKKSGRKGITIVEPAKKSPAKPKAPSKYNPPVRPMLLGPGSKLGKPLIPSGPSAPKLTSVLDAPKSRRTKSPLTKARMDRYRALLIAKRAELLGDVERMEEEALRSGSGGLSHTPQHIAEQGSESYDQALSLNLAAQDRRLIREIDEALKRIEDGTYGLCELTNQPIPEDRLDELPWARYTIEAARELETRGPLS